MEPLAATCFCARELLQSRGILSASDMADLFCRLRIYTFAISNDELEAIGSGFFREASMLNHSCSPNACYVFENRTMFVRALRDIAFGEEVLRLIYSVHGCCVDICLLLDHRLLHRSHLYHG